VAVHLELYPLRVSDYAELAIHSKVNVALPADVLPEIDMIGGFGLPELRHAEEREVDGISRPHKLHLIVIIPLQVLLFLVVGGGIIRIRPASDVEGGLLEQLPIK
jgi:hypothetical protein